MRMHDVLPSPFYLRHSMASDFAWNNY